VMRSMMSANSDRKLAIEVDGGRYSTTIRKQT